MNESSNKKACLTLLFAVLMLALGVVLLVSGFKDTLKIFGGEG